MENNLQTFCYMPHYMVFILNLGSDKIDQLYKKATKIHFKRYVMAHGDYYDILLY
jgi:hypothetical protein